MPNYDVSRAGTDLGAHFRGWRMILGLTAQQVCDRAGISRNTLRDLEQGRTSVGLESVLQVARALGVIDQLVEAVDPLKTDLGRARARLLGRKRVG